MRIGDVLRKKGPIVHTVGAQEPISDAITRFAGSKIRCLVVTEAEKMVGVLTIRDMLLLLDREGAEGMTHFVRAAMTEDVVFLTPDSTLEEAHALFVEQEINHLPVLEGDRLVGLVTRADVLANRVLDVEDFNAHMLKYISGSHF